MYSIGDRVIKRLELQRAVGEEVCVQYSQLCILEENFNSNRKGAVGLSYTLFYQDLPKLPVNQYKGDVYYNGNLCALFLGANKS